MKLTRRNFLAWASLSAVGAVACEGFGIREGEFSLQSPVSLPEDLVRGKDNWYATLCRTCPSSEGIVVRVMEGRAKKIQGNPLYPINQFLVGPVVLVVRHCRRRCTTPNGWPVPCAGLVAGVRASLNPWTGRRPWTYSRANSSRTGTTC